MATVFKNRVVDGKCCEKDCDPDDEPCKCVCCEDLPDAMEVCVWEIEFNWQKNNKECCTQYYWRAKNPIKGILTPDKCKFTTDGEQDGVVVLEMGDTDFWEWGANKPLVAGCDHVEGKYYDAAGQWKGSVNAVGANPAATWIGKDDAVDGDNGDWTTYAPTCLDRNTLDCDCTYTDCPERYDHDGDPETPEKCYDDYGSGYDEYYDCGDCLGCTDATKDNYDPNATVDNGVIGQLAGDCCDEGVDVPDCCKDENRLLPEEEGLVPDIASEQCV